MMNESTASTARDARPIRKAFKPLVSSVIMENDHVLLVREGSGKDRGRWNLPGGSVDPGEDLVTAAVRETVEECGFEVRPSGVSGVYTYTGSAGRNCVRFVFPATIVDGDPRFDGREIIDVRWFDFDEALAMPDEMLWKPAVLRRILTDARRGVCYPLELIRNFRLARTADRKAA
ncbi:MAG: NUDIX hydrolase [Phycisphaerales bacterium]